MLVALSTTSRAGAWSSSREAIRPALVAAQDEVRRCARAHAAPSGRYVFWIEVDARGRGRVSLREHPESASVEARRCLNAAYEAQAYPTALEATVAWSAASPPKRTYSIALPIVVSVNDYGYDDRAVVPRRVRPKPARTQRIER